MPQYPLSVHLPDDTQHLNGNTRFVTPQDLVLDQTKRDIPSPESIPPVSDPRSRKNSDDYRPKHERAENCIAEMRERRTLQGTITRGHLPRSTTQKITGEKRHHRSARRLESRGTTQKTRIEESVDKRMFTSGNNLDTTPDRCWEQPEPKSGVGSSPGCASREIFISSASNEALPVSEPILAGRPSDSLDNLFLASPDGVDILQGFPKIGQAKLETAPMCCGCESFMYQSDSESLHSSHPSRFCLYTGLVGGCFDWYCSQFLQA